MGQIPLRVQRKVTNRYNNKIMGHLDRKKQKQPRALYGINGKWEDENS